MLQAEATLGEQPRLHLLEQLPLERAGAQLPLALMARVLGDGRRELIVDARGLATMEDYFQRHAAPPRSVLALPLLKQGQTVGALYLENAAAAGVFTEARVSFLELLCANVVNAVDNARLVAELQELNASLERRVTQRTCELADSEERLRAVLDHAPIPMVVLKSMRSPAPSSTSWPPATAASSTRMPCAGPTASLASASNDQRCERVAAGARVAESRTARSGARG